MRTNLRRALAGGLALAVGMAPAVVGAAPATAAPHPAPSTAATAAPDNYDARHDPALAGRLAARAAVLATKAPVRTLSSQLGDQGIVDIDPLTGTPRQVARLDGFLTGPSRKPAVVVAATTSRRTPTCSAWTRQRCGCAATTWTSTAPTT